MRAPGARSGKWAIRISQIARKFAICVAICESLVTKHPFPACRNTFINHILQWFKWFLRSWHGGCKCIVTSPNGGAGTGDKFDPHRAPVPADRSLEEVKSEPQTTPKGGRFFLVLTGAMRRAPPRGGVDAGVGETRECVGAWLWEGSWGRLDEEAEAATKGAQLQAVQSRLEIGDLRQQMRWHRALEAVIFEELRFYRIKAQRAESALDC